MNRADELTTVGPIAREAGVHPDTVRRTVDRMVESGELPPCTTTGGHRHLSPLAAEVIKRTLMRRRLANAVDSPGSAVVRDGDRGSRGTVERRARHAEVAGADSHGGDLLTPDEAREEGRRYGLRLIQRYGDGRWHREQLRAQLKDQQEHPEKYAHLGDLLLWNLADPSSALPLPSWPPMVQDEVFRRVAARIERVVFHGIARDQVRRAVQDVVNDCYNRFTCPACGADKRLVCDVGSDCTKPGCMCEP